MRVAIWFKEGEIHDNLAKVESVLPSTATRLLPQDPIGGREKNAAYEVEGDIAVISARIKAVCNGADVMDETDRDGNGPGHVDEAA